MDRTTFSVLCLAVASFAAPAAAKAPSVRFDTMPAVACRDVTDDEFAFLGLALGTSLPSGSGPAVELTSEFAGRQCRWSGNIVRSEAIVDSRSRMVYLVAQVQDPYSNTQGNGGQPLAAAAARATLAVMERENAPQLAEHAGTRLLPSMPSVPGTVSLLPPATPSRPRRLSPL